jgi:regulatory protein
LKVEITDVIAVDSGNSVRLKVEICDRDKTDKRQLIISSSQYYDCGMIHPGIIDEEMFERLFEMANTYAAIRKGAELLGYSAANKTSLIRKLKERGFSHDNATQAVDYLSDKGYIDELAQAEKLIIRYAKRNLYGRRRIEAELFAKGYSRDVINDAFDSTDSDIDYEENKKKLIKTKFAGSDLSDFAVKQKVYSLLRRYGY